jgi:hypothetical protein
MEIKSLKGYGLSLIAKEKKARTEVDKLQIEKEKQALQYGKTINTLNKEVSDLKKKNEIGKESMVLKRLQETEIKLIAKEKQALQYGKTINRLDKEVTKLRKRLKDASARYCSKIDTLKKEVTDLQKENEIGKESAELKPLLQSGVNLMEENKQYKISEKNSREEIKIAKAMLKVVCAVVLADPDIIEVPVQHTRRSKVLCDALNKNTVLEARVNNYENGIKDAIEHLDKATAIDLTE